MHDSYYKHPLDMTVKAKKKHNKTFLMSMSTGVSICFLVISDHVVGRVQTHKKYDLNDSNIYKFV